MKPLQIAMLTDFSPLSEVALQFGARMSQNIDAEYTIINVVRLDGLPKSNIRMKTIEKSIHEIALLEGEQLVEKIRKLTKSGTKIHFKALKGHTVGDAIHRYTVKHKVDLVVLGSQGASSLKKLRLGGTAVSVIEMSKAPVLAVPKFAGVWSFKNVVYASDLTNVERELETIIPFARQFNSRIRMVHVVPAVDKRMELRRQWVERKIQEAKYSEITFDLLIDDNIPEAIDKFIREHKVDVLTTFTHELSLYDKLFGLSVTRTIAYQGNIPLLAFKRRGKKK
ncbi:MAG: universal stress protein [Cyclobacteriaceae bacterium]